MFQNLRVGEMVFKKMLPDDDSKRLIAIDHCVDTHIQEILNLFFWRGTPFELRILTKTNELLHGVCEHAHSFILINYYY